VCLRCVVLVSVYYRLCLVTVCMKVLQSGRLVRLSERTDCWCTFSCSICNQTATSSAISRAAVRKVMRAYTDHGKTSSAERNCGRQSKLGARDRCILKRIVPKHHRTAAAKVTAELNIHLEDADSTKTSDESFTNPTSTIQLQLLNL